jgi:hypothetical protein
MGSGLIITSNSKKLEETFKKFPKKAPTILKREWRTVGFHIVKKLKTQTARNLKKRTGQLVRGWTAPQLRGNTLGTISLTFVNETIYAIVHEEGRTITPKRAQYLAIPLGAAKTKGGVARIGPRDLPRKQTFVRNNIIFFKRRKDDRKPQAMFALKSSVTIPPRLNAEAVINWQKRKLEKAIDKAIIETWERT